MARLLEDVFRVGPQGGQSLLRGGLRGARREFLKLDTLRDLWSCASSGEGAVRDDER